MLDHLELAALFPVGKPSQRSEGTREQLRVRHGIAQSAVYEWGEPVKGMFEAIAPVDIGASAAEAIRCAPGGRGKDDRRAVVQRLGRRAHGQPEIRIAQPVVGNVLRHCSGVTVHLRGDGLRVGKIKRHAHKYAEVLVEVIADVGIELEHLAVRVQRSLKSLEAGKPFGRLQYGLVLGKSRNAHEQSKQKGRLEQKAIHNNAPLSTLILLGRCRPQTICPRCIVLVTPTATLLFFAPSIKSTAAALDPYWNTMLGL